MKKTALMLVLAAGAFSLSGCQKKAEEPAAAPAVEAPAESAAATTEAAAPETSAAAAASTGADDGKGNDVKK